jgi:hypothetical protein
VCSVKSLNIIQKVCHEISVPKEIGNTFLKKQLEETFTRN